MRQALWPDSQPVEVDELLAADGRRMTRLLVHERGDGRLGGFVEVGTRRWAEGCRSSPVAYLEGLWVDPELRRTGVARALVASAEAWALQRGLTELASDTSLDNPGSEAFHLACGFEETARVIGFRKALGGSD